MALELVPPSIAYRETFLEGLHELRGEGLAWWNGPDIELAERDFGAFVAKRLADATGRGDAPMPKTHLWGLMDGRFVGRISIFHALDEALRISGGHIGYDTVPSVRGRGIAKEMLRQSLPIAQALGLSEVLLTCDDTNTASIRVIEHCGGVLRATKPLATDQPLKRYYWISVEAGP